VVVEVSALKAVVVDFELVVMVVVVAVSAY
jgi:hypothetical protein